MTSDRRRLMMACFAGVPPLPPIDYTRYLRALNGAYIDTGIQQTNVGKLEVTFVTPDYPGAQVWQMIVGARTSYNSSNALAVYYNYNNKTLGASVGGVYVDSLFSNIQAGEEHTMTWDFSTQKVSLDGVEAVNVFGTPTGVAMSFYLFAANGQTNQYFTGMLRNCTLWDRSGTKIWEGAPYYEGGVIGFYDNVAHYLHTSSGVVLPVAEPPSTGLRLFDYIYANSLEYIDTGLDLSGADFSLTGTYIRFYNNAEHILAGNFGSPPGYWSLLHGSNTSFKPRVWIGSAVTADRATPAIGEEVSFELSWSGGTYTLSSGGATASGTQANANTRNVCLFSSPTQTNNRAYVAAKGEWVITAGGVVVRRMRPCSYNGEPGMWDSVNNVFYPNLSGNGAFMVG